MKFEPSHPPAGTSPGEPPPLTARFILEQDPFAGQPFTAKFRICQNPCCPCVIIGFECRREDVPDRPVRFDLDIAQRRIKTGSESTREGIALGKAFIAEARDEQWEWLGKLYLVTKRRQMEIMDLDTLAVQLPTDAIEGTMTAYLDLFPWADKLEFVHEGATWYADDQYCMRPGCNCHDAGLAFFPAFASGTPAKPLKLSAFIFFDYATGATKVDQSEPGGPAPAALMKSVCAVPNLTNTLRHRHGHLKRLGEKFQRESAHKPPRAVPLRPGKDPDAALSEWLMQPPDPRITRVLARPGRNDPCPCGSGKKYKKCCGR